MRIKKTLLSALAVTLLLAGCGTKQTTPQSLSLKEAFGDKFLVGVALNTRQVAGKKAHQTTLQLYRCRKLHEKRKYSPRRRQI